MAGRRKPERRAGGGGQNPYQVPDDKTRAAKAQGYPARSVFKLDEIDRRTRIFRPGQRVLDLGAAPGSWSMYAAQKVGAGGLVVAVDLQEIKTAFGPQVMVIEGDAVVLSHPDQAVDNPILNNAPYDCVISDMAPATSGNREADQWRSYELCASAIEIALRLTKPGGSFVGKIFMSEDFQRARDALRLGYETVRTLRPEGTRTVSSEVFLVGLQRRVEQDNP